MSFAPRRAAALTLAGLAIAGAVGLAGCGSKSGDAQAANRQVTVVGTGKVQGTPDTLNITAAIEATAPDVTTAMNQTSSRQQAVIDALAGAGIDKKDISTKHVELQPDYGQNSVITGYRASNSIDIKVRKLDTASDVLAKIVDAGGNLTRISGVAYSIDDDSQLVKDARTRAYNDAKDRAQQYAQLSGLALGRVVSISEATGSTTPTPLPVPRMAMAQDVPLSPGQQTVNFSVTVVWELG
ncbi:MAG: SIMPL domain-containing protein [Mycobacterium sp.]|nr:SIMPL domain-containing protein [Mycobacterium sp.]